jgi:hypothetical protein
MNRTWSLRRRSMTVIGIYRQMKQTGSCRSANRRAILPVNVFPSTVQLLSQLDFLAQGS